MDYFGEENDGSGKGKGREGGKKVWLNEENKE
jgi:hypothetical protein